MSAEKQKTVKKTKGSNPKEKKVTSAKGKKRVDVHYLTRVEGHGNIIVEIDEKGSPQTCSWEVPEAPRFFEAMLRNTPYQNVHHIVSRICGICSIGHQLASLQATEEAFGIQVTDQTVLLRKLGLHAENLQSHLLHIGYLALPDLLGVNSVLPLAETHKEELVNIIGCRRISNEFSRLICGRTTHPQRLVPGGMAKLPSTDDLQALKGMLEEALDRLENMVDLFAALDEKWPEFQRPTEYISLVSPTEYALYWGEIGSNKDTRRPAEQYKSVTNEYCVPQSTAKWTKNKLQSYMVGALARFNHNSGMLSPKAKDAAEKLKLKAPCDNPYYITVAQLVECVHSVEDSLKIVNRILVKGIKDEKPVPITPRAGRGVGAVEVPRGILFHDYEYDAKGRIVHANCVIPTNQNHANIQEDFTALIPSLTHKKEQEIELALSMLVRAYDPCISCSTHCIDLRQQDKRMVTFVRKKK